MNTATNPDSALERELEEIERQLAELHALTAQAEQRLAELQAGKGEAGTRSN